jgi:hypothetical protein
MIRSDWVNDSRDFAAKTIELQTLCARAAAPVDGDLNPLHIVLAPEYYFRMSPAVAVKKMKNTYHGTGTAAGQTRMDDQVLNQFQGRRTKNTMFSAREKELLIYHMCMSTRGKNVMVIPGTMFWKESEPVMQTRTVRKDLVVRKGVVRNTMWVIYRGHVLKTYHKRNGSHELDTFEEDKFDFRAGINDPVFEAGGLSFVGEVCADHASSSKAKNYVIEQGNLGMTPTDVFMHNKLTVVNGLNAGNDLGVDIHILVSDGMGLNAGDVAMRKGGFGLHCDAREPATVKTRHPQTGLLQDVNSDAPNFWKLSLGPSAAHATSFQDAKTAMQANFKPRFIS